MVLRSLQFLPLQAQRHHAQARSTRVRRSCVLPRRTADTRYQARHHGVYGRTRLFPRSGEARSLRSQTAALHIPGWQDTFDSHHLRPARPIRNPYQVMDCIPSRPCGLNSSGGSRRLLSRSTSSSHYRTPSYRFIVQSQPNRLMTTVGVPSCDLGS